MNSAAVIGRQLRQQHPPQQAAGRNAVSGPLAPPSPGHKGRPRTPSHQPHPTQQLPSPPKVTSPKQQTSQQQQQKDQKQQQEKGLSKMSCISCHCIWLCFKALSGGVLLIAIGVGMTVFGFYADHFAVHEQLDSHTNTTMRVVNEHIKIHLHNLTYVGPVFMGLGGMMIVAACVLIDAQEDDLARDNRNRRPSDVEGTEHLIAAPAKSPPSRCNGPMPFFSLDLPPARVQDKGGGEGELEQVVTVAEVVPTTFPVSLSSSVVTETPLSTTSSLSSPPLRIAVRQKKKRTMSHSRRASSSNFLSPLFDVPSPADIQILDPDGCTPDGSTFLEMDVFRTTKCPPQQRIQFEPRYLASIESDGLSDSDTAESGFTTTTGSRRGGGGGYCSPCELEEQDMPLLGRCSPPSSPEFPVEPLLKRDRTGLRRFQLMRQVPHSLFDGPEGGGSR